MVCGVVLTPLCSDYECPICFDFRENEKCFRKNSVAHILFEMGEVEKYVKLRILRIQSVESFGNPNLLIVEFFRLASIKAVFFFFFSDWHLLKLFSFFRLASAKAVFCSPVC